MMTARANCPPAETSGICVTAARLSVVTGQTRRIVATPHRYTRAEQRHLQHAGLTVKHTSYANMPCSPLPQPALERPFDSRQTGSDRRSIPARSTVCCELS
jgi:hypothetical protein